LENLSLALNFSRLNAGAGVSGNCRNQRGCTKPIMFTDRNQHPENRHLMGKSAKSREC
jgi:hypothetical protein